MEVSSSFHYKMRDFLIGIFPSFPGSYYKELYYLNRKMQINSTAICE